MRTLKLLAVLLAAALGTAGPGPAWAQDGSGPIDEVVPPIEVGSHLPVDLGPLTWRVSGGDGSQLARPDYDDEAWVARPAVSPDLLHNRVVWYRFHFVTAPDALGLGSELVLGGVEGNATVYLNGTPIAKLCGAVDPPYERTATFRLPESLISYHADNVLALRLSGFTGEPLVGIPVGPIRLAAFSPAPDPGHEVAPEQPSPATGPRPFGRFGGGDDAGLLTCRLHPDGFASATTSLAPVALTGRFGSPGPGDRTVVESLSPVGKIVRVEQALGPGYRVFYPLLYPGFAIEADRATLSVHLGGNLDVLYVDRWGIATHSASVNAQIPWSESWLGLADRQGRKPPLLVALPSPRWPISLARTQFGVDLLLPAGAIARFCWPWGIAPHELSPTGADMARIRRWAEAMIPFSLRTDDRIEGGWLHAHDRFGYLPVGSLPYAPVPPALAFASMPGSSAADEPAAVSGQPSSGPGLPTLAGPLRVAFEADDVEYDLPAPALEIPTSGATPSAKLPDLAAGLARSAVDLAYRGRARAYLHWSELSASDRAALQANSAYQIPRAWSAVSWASSTEPESGTVFDWTEARVEDTGKLGGYGLGNGLSLYGTSQAGIYGGNWGLIRQNWPALQRAFEWFTDAFDWAWQASCDSERGRSTGDGQTLAAGYLGALGMARMARVVEPGDQNRYLALAARMAVLAGDRPALASWARRQGLLAKGEEAIGLSVTGVEAATGSDSVFGPLAGWPDIAALSKGEAAGR